jgi:DNA modification methylase
VGVIFNVTWEVEGVSMRELKTPLAIAYRRRIFRLMNLINASSLPQKRDNFTQQEWYQLLVDECKAIITEATFTSRWALVEGYWNLGKLIKDTYKTRKDIYGKKIAQDLAESIGISERTINYACAAYEKYPDIGTLPEGKNISWNKLITKYLPEPPKSIEPLSNEQKANFKKQVIQGDCIEEMKKLPDKSIDMIYVDPPYNMGKGVWDTFKDDEFLIFTENWIRECIRLLKDRSHLFINFSSDKMAWLENLILEDYSILPVSRIIWNYRNAGGKSSGKTRFSKTYEPILHYNFGDKELNFPSEWDDTRFDVWTIAIPQANFDEGHDHPTQKPVELLDRLVRYGSFPGEVILDPMAGSGTTGVACIKNDRDFTLIEKQPEYIDQIYKRLNEANNK